MTEQAAHTGTQPAGDISRGATDGLLNLHAAWIAPEDCTFPSCDHVEQAKQDWEYTADTLPQIVCLLDAAGLIVRANRTLEAWGLGSVTEARGLCLHDLLHPRCTSPECYLRTFASEHRDTLAREPVVQCQAMDPLLGRHLDIRIYRHAGGDNPNTVERKDCSVALVADITELMAMKEALQGLTRELEQRVEVRTAQLAEANRQLRQEAQERKLVEDELRRSRDSYQSLVESMNEGLVVRDKNDRITYVNNCLARMLGYEPGQIVGRQAAQLFSEANPESWAARTLQRRTGDATPYNMALCSRHGDTIWAKVSPRPIYDADGDYAGSFAVITDITERVLAEKALYASEAELRELSAQVLTAQETERKRIASELHDGIGQTLSAVKFSIENIIDQVHSQLPEPNLVPLQAIVPKLQRAIEEVRHISMALRPSILDDLGILATLRWFCREYQVTYQDIQLDLEADADEVNIPSAIKVVIFRIVQEALNNVAKYSGARHLRVCLEHSDRGLELELSDDGIGFDPAQIVLRRGPDSSGMGLVSMRERAEYFGGEFSLDSRQGEGTSIHVLWPNPAEADGG